MTGILVNCDEIAGFDVGRVQLLVACLCGQALRKQGMPKRAVASRVVSGTLARPVPESMRIRASSDFSSPADSF